MVPLRANQMGWYVAADCCGLKCCLSVPWMLNISTTMLSAKHPYTITPPPPCFMVGTTNVETICSPFLFLRHGGWNQQSEIWTFVFLGLSTTLLLPVPGFFAAIRPWRPDSESLLWTVNVEMCLQRELCEAYMWALIWAAVNFWFLRLVTLNILSCTAEVTHGLLFSRMVLMKASFPVAFEGFHDCTWINIQSSWNFPDWLIYMS